jgi:hypothetical protein
MLAIADIAAENTGTTFLDTSMLARQTAQLGGR